MRITEKWGEPDMLKCASVYTCEVDNADVAIKEIHSQLTEKISLLENTIGIIMCHIEFIESGVLAHICANLPFDVAGVTTSSQAVNETADDMILTVFVMTSDDVYFRAGMTGSLEEGVYQSAKNAYDAIGLAETPKLALVFPPLPEELAGDTYVNAWERIIPGVPVFGTFSTADTVDFTGGKTIYNGITADDRTSYVFCYGNINPRFFIGVLSEKNALPYRGEVTKSDGVFVEEINDVNAYKFFEERGLAKDGLPISLFTFVPFLIDQKNRTDYDGVPILRELVKFNQEGIAVFRGNVDEHSTFRMLQGTFEDVLQIAREKHEEAASLPGINGILTFSCIARRMMVMQTDSLGELSIAREIIGNIPFMMGYAGGELCPTSVRGGVATNRYHDYSLIIMVV